VPFENRLKIPNKQQQQQQQSKIEIRKIIHPSADQATKVEKSQVAPAASTAPTATVQHHRVGTQPVDPMRPGKCVCADVGVYIFCVFVGFFLNSYVLAYIACTLVRFVFLVKFPFFAFPFLGCHAMRNISRVFVKRMSCTISFRPRASLIYNNNN
jgi:hypothetical protein